MICCGCNAREAIINVEYRACKLGLCVDCFKAHSEADTRLRQAIKFEPRRNYVELLEVMLEDVMDKAYIQGVEDGKKKAYEDVMQFITGGETV